MFCTFTIFNGMLRYIWIGRLYIMIWHESSKYPLPFTKLEVHWDNE